MAAERLRAAVISNLYPPHFIGGYEITMSWIANELRRRGHHVDVFHAHEFYLFDITGKVTTFSHHGEHANFDIGPCIWGALDRAPMKQTRRLLFLLHQVVRSQINFFKAKKRLKSGRYDLILLGSPLGLLVPIHEYATRTSETGTAVSGFFVGDDWVASWPVYDLLNQFRDIKPALSGLSSFNLATLLTLVVSIFIRYGASLGFRPRTDVECWPAGFAVAPSKYILSTSQPKLRTGTATDVVPCGVPDSDAVLVRPLPDFESPELVLAFAGQIEGHKGLLTILQAMSQSHKTYRLVVFGNDTTIYARLCKRFAVQTGLAQRVLFKGKLSPQEVMNGLGQCHVLIVPSNWAEPFGIVAVQGMMAGLVTIVSNIGGLPEIVRDRENGLLFPPKNAAALGALLDELFEDRAVCRKLSACGRADAARRFTIEGMADRILEITHRCASTKPPSGRSGATRTSADKLSHSEQNLPRDHAGA